MRLMSKKHWIRLCGASIAVIAMVAASTISGSCALDSKTTLCEQFDLRCKEGQECATNDAVCIPIGGCGNNRIDPGEKCDDGNVTSGDGCSADCKSDETCGNNIIDKMAAIPEQCDDGPNNGMPEDNCDAHCHLRDRACGNGMVDVDVGEQCDPSLNFLDTIDCNSSAAGSGIACRAPRCGDGYTNTVAGEDCDTSGAQTRSCNGITCKFSVCGDNIHNPAAEEDCDNGLADTRGCNGNNGDSTTDCKFPACGDGHANLAAGEECDSTNGSDTSTCNGKIAGVVSCKSAACGDGYLNAAAGEQCEPETSDGKDSSTCNGKNAGDASCKPAACGDGYKNTAAGEQCDDGKDSSTCNGNAAGSASCKIAACGDGYRNIAASEMCDDGNHKDNDSCPDDQGTCQSAICGDHFIWNTDGGQEQCDDGGDSSTCNGKNAGSAGCQFSFCGDGYTNTAAGEQCETSDGKDSSTCNGTNAGKASCKLAVCGDGYVNPNFKPDGMHAEQCDPGDPMHNIPPTNNCPPSKTCAGSSSIQPCTCV